jgi:hypothetical protein
MTLPVSRNTTYAAGAQVKSVDMNAIQDEIIALFGSRNLSFGVGNATGQIANSSVNIDLPLKAGDRITAFRVYGTDNGTNRFTCTLIKINLATGATTTVGTATSAGTAGAKYAEVTGLAETQVATSRYLLSVSGPSNGGACYGGYVAVDWPPA